jgi:hypothetical protein
VPIELFNQVQERIAKNKKAPARYKAKEELYLLTTNLFCGLCGAYMVGESGTSKTGKTHQYYKCATAKHKKACKKESVKKDWIENFVMIEITKMLLDEAMIERIVNEVMTLQDRENIALPVLQKQLDETRKGIENILDAIQKGIFTTSMKERLEKLEDSKKELEVEILQEELFRPWVALDKIRFWLHKFRDGDLQDTEHRQRLVDSFVNAIYLYDNKIVLTFNYKDGTKTISLKDIESSDLSKCALPPHRGCFI